MPSYDAHWRIGFRTESTVMVGSTPLQFFHLGRYFRAPVTKHAVEDSTARDILYRPTTSTFRQTAPAHAIKDVAGFAGFRIMRSDLKTD